MSSEKPSAGWYAKPDGPLGTEHWWDGDAWTGHSRGISPPASVSATSAAKPKRRRRRLRWVWAILALIILIAVIVDAAGGSGSKTSIGANQQVPAAPTSPAPSAPSPAPVPKSNLTEPEQNAQSAAKNYLTLEGFSKAGLIGQLSSSAGDGYPVKVATVAVDSLHVNYDAEAVKSAKNYLAISSFSCAGMIQQLDSTAGSQFTATQAKYAAVKVGLC